MRVKRWHWLIVLSPFFLVACLAPSSPLFPLPDTTAVPTHPQLDPTYEALIAAQRHPDVPELPFADNPDPSLCGIPIQWGNEDPAWLTGFYEGELLQETVLLYDSHLRMNIAAKAPHGTQVEVLLYQQNPNLDYYLVKVVGTSLPNEGWIPAPFLSFSPVMPLSSPPDS